MVKISQLLLSSPASKHPKSVPPHGAGLIPPKAGLLIEPGLGTSFTPPKPLGVIGKVNGSQTHIAVVQSPLGSPVFAGVVQVPLDPVFHVQEALPIVNNAESNPPLVSVPLYRVAPPKYFNV